MPAYAFTLDFDNGGSIFTGPYRFYDQPRVVQPRPGAATWPRSSPVLDQLSQRLPARLVADADQFVGTKFGLAASYLQLLARHADLRAARRQRHGRCAIGAAAAPADPLAQQQPVPAGAAPTPRASTTTSTRCRSSPRRALAPSSRSARSATSATRWAAAASPTTRRRVGGSLRSTRSTTRARPGATDYQIAGHYVKLLLGGSRLQALPNKDYLFLAARRSSPSKNLDSSEKFSLGGPLRRARLPLAGVAVRHGRLIGPGNTGTRCSSRRLPGDVVFGVFGDYGYRPAARAPAPTDTGNTRKLMSHGVGITYGNDRGLHVKAWVAVRGGTRAQSDDSRARCTCCSASSSDPTGTSTMNSNLSTGFQPLPRHAGRRGRESLVRQGRRG